MNPLLFDLTPPVAHIRLNRPSKRNALSRELLSALSSALDHLEQSSDVRAVLISGEGPHFCAGADLNILSGLEDPASAVAFSRYIGGLFNRLAALPQLTLAALEGYTLGGGLELSLACDLRVAGEGTLFGTPEIKLGLFPAAGGSVRMPLFFGPSLARRLLLLGDPVGPGALPPGFLLEVTEKGSARATGAAYLDKAAAYPGEGTAVLKDLMRQSPPGPDAFEKEQTAFGKAFAHPGVREALKAFLGKKA